MAIKAGITFMSKFVQPGKSHSGGYGSFVDYIAREDAVFCAQFDQFADYMSDSKKSIGLFNEKGLLDEKSKKELKDKMNDAEAKGSLLWQQVFSFDMEWLRMNHIYDPALDFVNEKDLRKYTAAAVKKMLDKEGCPYLSWMGSIHHNTGHVHVHVAMFDPEPSFEENTRRCRKDKNGKVYQRGKFRQKSINAAKSEFTNQIIKSRERNNLINTLIRDDIVNKIKNDPDPFFKDDVVSGKFVSLLMELPDDLRLWKYNNNAMKNFKNRIDDLSDEILKKYFSDEIEELYKTLEFQEKNYNIAYGKNSASYKDSKIKELHERVGNSILSVGRKLIINKKKHSFKKTNKSQWRGKDPFLTSLVLNNNRAASQQISYAMSLIRRACRKDIQSTKNQAIYEQMQREMGYDPEI